MCQSYNKTCVCGQNTAEIFFGNMLLNETAVSQVYCPECSHAVDTDKPSRVWDNGWVLELNMDFVRTYAATFGMAPGDITAEWIFDFGYATWVGITPDDTQRRNTERAEIQKLAKTDVLAYVQAMKEWGIGREKRFTDEGWRKMTRGRPS